MKSSNKGFIAFTVFIVVVVAFMGVAVWVVTRPLSDDRLGLRESAHVAEMEVGKHNHIVKMKELDVFLKKRCERETERTLEIERCRKLPTCALTMRDLVLRVDRIIWTPDSGRFVLTWRRKRKRGTIKWTPHGKASKR